jgi:aspartyl protease family protein
MAANTPDPTQTQRLGKGFIWGAWILVLALLTWFFNGVLEHQRNPNQHLDTQILADGVRELTLEGNRFGHYVATGAINGRPVQFLLDTGATDVSIPGDLADSLGLRRGPARYYETANGTITAYATVLDRLSLGGIELTGVRASINPAYRADQVLLGMSALRRLEFTQRGDTLILRQHPGSL